VLTKKTAKRRENPPTATGIIRDNFSPHDREKPSYTDAWSQSRRVITMAGKPRSLKEAQAQLSRQLRTDGRTWGEVSAIFQSEYGVNARVAMRLAHCWSQTEVARRWNERWPQEPKTFKSISYWEQWPNRTGYVPSLDVLSCLAELYECHIADLIRDCADHRDSDPMHVIRKDLERLPALITISPRENGNFAEDDEGDQENHLAQFIDRLQNSDVNELAQTAATWTRQFGESADRRSLLLKVSYALTLAATASSLSADADQGDLRRSDGIPDLSGIWRSEYSYFSTGQNASFSDIHYVVISQTGAQIEAKGLPHTTGSEVSLSLSVSGLATTGTWEERTSPTGYYKGAIYRGAIQMLLSPTLTEMTGKWLGFGKNFAINNGDWSLTLESRSTSPKKLREYSLKV